MRLRLTLRNVEGSEVLARDVRVSVPAGTTLAEVAAQLRAAVPSSRQGEPRLWSGTRLLPPAALLGGPGLREGDIVSVGAPGEPDAAAGAVLRLHVVGGPDAGRVTPLPRGVFTIGRAGDCDLVLADADVSRRHASITVTPGGITVRDLGSTNGTRIDSAEVDADGSPVQPGQLLSIGESRLAVVAADDPAAALRPGADGLRLVNRPPRLTASLTAQEVELPVQQPAGSPQPAQWLAALLPALAGAVLATVMHNLIFLAFALMSPLMIIGTVAGDRLHWRRSRRRAAAALRAQEASAGATRAALLAAEQASRRRAHADPAAVLRTASVPDCRLWERRRQDPDALEIRVGLGAVSSELRARRGPVAEPAGTLSSVPVTFGLRSGPLGIAAPRGIALGTARWMIGQLAVLHSPADLQLAFLLSDDAAPAWTWARWLPHLPHHADRVARTAEQRQLLVGTLLRLVDERRDARVTEPAGWPGPWTVLLVDRSGSLADLPGLARLLRDGPAAGVSAVCVDEHERRLPTACTGVARVCGETGSRIAVRVTGGTELPEAIADRVGGRWAERVARALASLADAAADTSAALPANCRLLDLLGLDDPEPAAVLRRWEADAGPVTPIGIGVEGPLTLDLLRDGPHTLVAGTTGAGKSELLQSLVAGLAAGAAPSAIAFVLIDYKGGAAFAQCAQLPHTAGLVTDLDPYLTRRALWSLDAELRRREALFAAAQAKDLEAYRRSPCRHTDPLGRLVLVVDEFAALAEELPDFINGLVGIAQRGRSLGVHLVLATQRPGGVVSPEIRANVALRIALRVTDPVESVDVIGTDAAAALDQHTPGRALVRAADVVTEIQTARIGGPARAAGAPAVVPLDEWGQCGADAEEDPHSGKTDLALLVDAIREAAAVCGAGHAPRPWLPPLPEVVPVASLPPPRAPESVPVALADLPDEQRQEAVTVDLAEGGPTLIVGGPRSGRSTALRTLAVTAAARLGPSRLHLYGLDCAGGALRTVAELPHCAAVVGSDDFASAERVLARLSAEVARRHALLAEAGAGSVDAAQAGAAALPYLVLLVDGWEGFLAAAEEYDAGRSVDALLNLMRESASVGMTIVLAGDRGALAPRVASAVARKFVLRLADRADYALAGLPHRIVPERLPPGRGIRVEDGVEVQFALLAPDAGAANRVVAEVAASARATAGGSGGPLPLRPLPARVLLAELAHGDDGRTVLGAGSDDAGPVAVDLFAGGGRWLLAGPPRSGRTNVLLVILAQLVGAGIRVLVAAPRRSGLLAAAGGHAVPVFGPEDDPARLPPPVDGRLLVLVDDSEAFLDTAAGDGLTALARSASDGLAVVVAGRSEDLALTYRGVAAEVRRAGTGLLLQPGPGDGELLGLRLPRTRAPATPGRGLLVACQPQLAVPDGGTTALPIQVPLPW